MKVYLVSLGCDKNLVDSEMMAAAFKKSGHVLTDAENAAQVIVVNTCCFIADAQEESINTLLAMAEYKKSGSCQLLVAAGCLAQRFYRQIKEQIPEVDVIIGTAGYADVAAAIDEGLKAKGVVECLPDIDHWPEPEKERDSLTGGYTAYLKIAEGCDKHCTYCVIPSVRGRYRSVPMPNLIAQAKHLAQNGAKELILVAQETTLYGVDLYGKKSLPSLLRQLEQIRQIVWIRILYCYPEEIDTELIDTIVQSKKICHYLDIPVQHAADNILQRMGRKTTRAQTEEKINELRKKIPDMVIRTTLIVGFPGETKKDVQTLLDFVRKMRFERLGVFCYSAQEGTPAEKFPRQVAENTKKKRKDLVMQTQQEVAFLHAKEQIGKTFPVMVEGRLPEENIYLARTYMDAPEVDGYVFVETEGNFLSGDFITVEITGANGYDLIGKLTDKEEI